MRKVMVLLVAGMVVACAAPSLALADGAKTAPVPATDATMSLKPSQATVSPGDVVTVEVLVNNIKGLACYQAAVKAVGGEKGKLSVEDIIIDTARADYVFGKAQKLPATDKVGLRAGCTLWEGSVDVSKPAYLATFKLRASEDAKGVFEIALKADPEVTFLTDRDVKKIAFNKVAAKVTVEQKSPLRSTERKAG